MELDHPHSGRSFLGRWRRVFSVSPLSARELHESYRQAYISFVISDGKIARYSEQVV
jgi:hypothetical protein